MFFVFRMIYLENTFTQPHFLMIDSMIAYIEGVREEGRETNVKDKERDGGGRKQVVESWKR